MVAWPWRAWLSRVPATRVSMHEGYALWAGAYPARPHNPVMEAEQAAVGPMVMAAAPRRALDVGTGTGRNLSLLERAGARVIVGIDLSMAMLGRAAYPGPLVRGDACRLPFADGRFNLVSASLMAGDVPDLGPWIAEATRVLEPGGHLVYSDFHPSWAAEQWRRTFRAADGRQFEIAYHAHTIEEHLDPMERAGLQVRAIREPRVHSRRAPVVVVFHAVKRARGV